MLILYQAQIEISGYSEWFLLRRLHISWKRFLSIVYALKLVGERDHAGTPGALPLLCTIERPSPETPYEMDYYLVFPYPAGNLSDLSCVDSDHFKSSEQLTDRWLASQCYSMAASLWEIHRIAALKMPHVPRMRFLGSGRLDSDVIYWLSSSKDHLGTLVIADHNSCPPGMFESAPEYSMHQEEVLKSARHGDPILLDQTLARLGSCEITYAEPRQENSQPKLLAPTRPQLQKVDPPGSDCSRSSRHHLRDGEPIEDRTNFNSQTSLGALGPGPPIHAPRFHVWCLGVVWLELITWYILGRDGTLEFEQTFAHVYMHGQAAKSGFFEKLHIDDASGDGNPYRLRHVVSDWIERLQADKNCSLFAGKVLELIAERMLVVDVSARASSREVMEKMEEMKDRGEETNA